MRVGSPFLARTVRERANKRRGRLPLPHPQPPCISFRVLLMRDFSRFLRRAAFSQAITGANIRIFKQVEPAHPDPKKRGRPTSKIRPTAPTCIVWSWRCTKGPMIHCVVHLFGYARLMSPNKDETAFQYCWCQGEIGVRYWPRSVLVYVCHLSLFSLPLPQIYQ